MPHRIGQLFRHSAIYGLGDVAGKAVGLILIPLYTNCLSPEEYGLLSLTFLFIAFGFVFYLLGVNSAFFRYFITAEKGLERQEVFSTAFLFILSLAVALTGLLSFLSGHISGWLLGSDEHLRLIRLSSLIMAVDSLSLFTLLLLRGENRPGQFVGFVVAKLAVVLTFNFLLVGHLRWGVPGVLTANLVGSSSQMVLLIPLLSRNLRLNFDAQVLQRMLRFGLPLVPPVVATLTIDLSDRYILEHFRGLREVGIYSLGYRFGLAISLIVSAFRFAWMPFVFQVAKERDPRSIYARVLTYFVLVVSFFYLSLCLLITDIFRLLVSPSYWSAAAIVPLIALSYFMAGVHLNTSVGAYVKDRTHHVALATAVAAGLNLILNLLLIPPYGMWGAAVATLISYTALATTMFALTQRYYPISYDWKKIARIFAIGGFIFWLGRIIDFDTGIVGMVEKSFLILGYLLLLYGFRVFSRAEIGHIPTLFARRGGDEPT